MESSDTLILDTKPASRPRDATFDIVKGVGILEVMTHHLLSHSARKFTLEGAWDWWVMQIAHRVLHFAVPTFLLISALLLAKSLLKFDPPNWRRFYLRRVERTLLPYLVWTLIYLLFRLKFAHNDAELTPRAVVLPLFGSLTLPRMLTERELWVSGILWGKTYYHLYFLGVLLQFSLLFGVLYSLLRRVKKPFLVVFFCSFGLQLFAFWLNAIFLYPVLHFTTPASSILWYVPAFLIGTWLGLHYSDWDAVWRRYFGLFYVFAIVGLGIYMGLEIAAMRGAEPNSYLYNMALTAYTTGMALLLLRFGQWLVGQGRGGFLQRIGNWSLPLFLIHPMALYFLSGPRLSVLWGKLPGGFLILGVLMFLVSWGVSWLIMKARLDRLCFGRVLSTASGNA